MKRNIMAVLVLVAGGWFVPSARADLLAYEGFDLAAGENALTGSGGATSFGWSGNWTNTTADIGAGLGYGDLASVGGSAVLDGANSAANRGLSTSLSSGTIWLSFLAVVPTNNSYSGLSLYDAFNTEMLFIGDVSAGTNWGLQMPGSGKPPLVTSSVSTTNQAFLTLRIDFNAASATNENIYLWVNPAHDSEPLLASAQATLLGAQMGNGNPWTRIRLQQGGTGNNGTFDEIRIGQTWSDVTPVVPEPGTLALLGFALAGAAVWRGRRSPGPAPGKS